MDNNTHRKFVHHLHALIVLVLAVIILAIAFKDRTIGADDFMPADPTVAEPFLFRAK